MSRENSYEFESYFSIAVIHDAKLRDYVVGKVKPDFLNHWGPKMIYETVTRLHKRSKLVSFITVEEDLKLNLDVDDTKLEELIYILRSYKDNPDVLDGIAANVIPRIEEEVGRTVLTSAIVVSQSMLEEGKYQEIFTLFEKTKMLALYQQTKESNFWDRVDLEESQMPWEKGIPLGVHGQSQEATIVRVDEYLYNKGLPKGCLAIFGGSAKGGKTALMQNVGVYESLSGYNVDYYLLEGDMDYLHVRTITMLTGIETNVIRTEENTKKAKIIIDKIREDFPNKGDMRYYKYPPNTLTPSMIKQNIIYSNRSGRNVGVVIVDYVDRMACEKRYRDSWQEAGYNVLELRALGEEYGVLVITASQLDKEAYNKKLATRKNIRGAYSKIFDCDLFATISTEMVKTINGTEFITNFFMDATRFGDSSLLLQLEGNLRTGRMFNPVPEV